MSKSKAITITLSQRQWDHVLISLDQAAYDQQKICDAGKNFGLDMEGAKRSAERLATVSHLVAEQYREQTSKDLFEAES